MTQQGNNLQPAASRSFRNKNETIIIASYVSLFMCQLDNSWTDYHEIWYWEVLLESVHKFQFRYKSDKNKETFEDLLASR